MRNEKKKNKTDNEIGIKTAKIKVHSSTSEEQKENAFRESTDYSSEQMCLLTRTLKFK